MNSAEAKDLFKQFRNNDKNAIDRLYKTYSRKLYNFAFAYLKTEEDALDVVQNVFINIWNKRDCLNDNTNLEAYLFTITKNSVISIFRKKTTEKEYLDYLHYKAVHQYSVNGEQYDYQNLSTRIKELTEQLPAQRKIVFKLSKEKGLSNRAIAEELNISVKTVEDHMTKARHFMKSQLTEYGILAILFYELFV